ARAGLRQHAAGPGERVVLLAPNSTRWVAADLAILAEGGVCVPLYARQAVSELVEMMKDADPKLVVVADEELASRVSKLWSGAPVITFAELFVDALVDAPAAPRDPDEPATIIYTSGTSGEAKGVVLSVANVDYMLPVIKDAVEAMMGSTEADHRVFHYLPFCFAGSRMVLWMCLYRRNNVMMSTDLDNLKVELAAARPNYVLNVPTLLERIKEGVEKALRDRPRAVQVIWQRGKAAWANKRKGTANFFDKASLAVAQRVVFGKVRAQIGPELRCLIAGSAPLGEDTQNWFEMIGLPVYQVYGLTETTAIVTMDKPGSEVAGWVGQAITGCETRIGDEGELLVRGPNIFKGYWRREEATAESFAEGGWFKTGDQVEQDKDGRYRIIGRVRNLLVPSSGHNVAPEPIEQKIIGTIVGVEQCVVIGHARPYLTAIVTGDVDRETVERGLEKINEELPHYRRIRKFHLTNERFTPENGLLTANTKLKRKAIEKHFNKVLEAMYR
ncbi:MAG: hypothetical protein EP329_09115, partial [Deltaproteobacteria bacterium]